jgi:hypothetical protein
MTSSTALSFGSFTNPENGVKVGNAGARELDEGENTQDPGYGKQADHQQHSHCYFAAKTENGDVSFSRTGPILPLPKLKLKFINGTSSQDL